VIPNTPLPAPAAAPGSLDISWLEPEDVVPLVVIERASGMEEIWSVPQFHYLITSKTEGCLVARWLRVPVGYAAFRTDDLEPILLSIVVGPSWRRQGIGRALLEALYALRYFRLKGSCRTYVRESSLAAQLFLKACGFRCEGIRPGVFDCPPEDAYLFRKPVLTAPEETAP
jgi:ribosomal protein S18 acetylase RimI-like enzyme